MVYWKSDGSILFHKIKGAMEMSRFYTSRRSVTGVCTLGEVPANDVSTMTINLIALLLPSITFNQSWFTNGKIIQFSLNKLYLEM